ncbi:hypothetical protein [Prosthecobacter sp.]|uniref:hypothetical protein n=1 Tax=Prosthecobacter sp. TaxID=1965333 RepID=UPI0037837249
MSDDTMHEGGPGEDCPQPLNLSTTPPPTAPHSSPEASPKPEAADEPAKTANGKKESTIELPMFDLEEIVRVISKIHADGLEMAKVDDVARAFGYKTSSSTPFYRRLVAGRHFGLIVSNGADLTVRARDILQPTQEGSKEEALAQAALSHQYYAQWVSRLSGRRLNLELVTNDIEREYGLTKPCAKRCAEVLADSLRFAGLMLPDGIVRASSLPANPARSSSSSSEPGPVEADDPETQTHTLFLDRHKQRKFVMTAPISVSQAELQRICKWLEVSMIVDDVAG